jgi:hypothetical protein
MLLLVLKLLQRLPAFVSQYDPPDVLLPSALPLSEFLVSSARDTFATRRVVVMNWRTRFGVAARVSVDSERVRVSFRPERHGNKGVTFDAFLRGLVSIRDHSNDALMETMGAVSAPLHLLTVDAERKLQVNEAALQELRQYNCSLKIVGVLGAYRTGKSYLLNLLFDRPDGFKLGSTVKGETRGVWIAVRRSTVPGAPAIALLDTEGLSDVENPDEDYDLRIMTITLLLSSLLLINVKGTIDSGTFRQLGFVTRLSKSIKCKANESSDEAGGEFAQIFPHLLFVVRDTMLEIGESNEAFLERVLAPLPKATSVQARRANEVRDMLQVWFPTASPVALGQAALQRERVATHGAILARRDAPRVCRIDGGAQGTRAGRNTSEAHRWQRRYWPAIGLPRLHARGRREQRRRRQRQGCVAGDECRAVYRCNRRGARTVQ